MEFEATLSFVDHHESGFYGHVECLQSDGIFIGVFDRILFDSVDVFDSSVEPCALIDYVVEDSLDPFISTFKLGLDLLLFGAVKHSSIVKIIVTP